MAKKKAPKKLSAKAAAKAAEEKRLLAGLARWEKKKRKELSERAQRAAATRAANKAAALAAAQKRSDAAKRGAATRAANKAGKAGQAPPGPSGARPGGGGVLRLPPSGPVGTLDDWERRGDWLQAGARPVIFHVGSEYHSKFGIVKIELAVQVSKLPDTKLSANLLREAALYWINTGEQPAGMEFLAISWEREKIGPRGGRGTFGPKQTITETVDGAGAMDGARTEMLGRFFHLG